MVKLISKSLFNNTQIIIVMNIFNIEPIINWDKVAGIINTQYFISKPNFVNYNQCNK